MLFNLNSTIAAEMAASAMLRIINSHDPLYLDVFTRKGDKYTIQSPRPMDRKKLAGYIRDNARLP